MVEDITTGKKLVKFKAPNGTIYIDPASVSAIQQFSDFDYLRIFVNGQGDMLYVSEPLEDVLEKLRT